MSFYEMLQVVIPTAIFFSVPLIFTALGGVFCERSGVVNIGLEGLMMVGAFVAVVFNLTFVDTFGDLTPWISLIVAIFVGAIFSLIHAVAAVSLRADQVVSGIAVNFLAAGGTMFLVKMIYDKGQTDQIMVGFNKIDIPLLSKIPVIGPLFFSNAYLTSFLAFFVAFASWYVIYKTPFGLRLRAVGEHPMGADTMGINVFKMRYIAVMISGAFAAVGGAVYATIITKDYSHGTISGHGFMAMAAMIFGKWHPLGAMGAALFFGLAQSLSIVGTTLPMFANVPPVYLEIAPYVLTILALTGLIGRADAPKASGRPYVKGSR